MSRNPVFREGVQVYFHEGHGFVAYFYLLVILAPVEFFALFIPSLDVQIWTGSANLFKVTSVTALLVMVYFALRLANQEFAPWRFLPLRRWFRERGVGVATVEAAQLALLSVHVGLFVLLCAPLLVWAGAVARTNPVSVFSTLLLLVFYCLSYGIWGLVTSVVWERRSESRQVFVRCLFFCLVVLSALLYLPLNPVAYILSHLGREELTPLSVAGSQWPAAGIHFVFHGLLFVSGLAAHRWALQREANS